MNKGKTQNINQPSKNLGIKQMAPEDQKKCAHMALKTIKEEKQFIECQAAFLAV